MSMLRSAAALLAGLLFGAADPVAAVTIEIRLIGVEYLDFDGFAHGQVVPGVTANNPNRSFHYPVAFDTNESGTADPDLERGSGWSGGNLAPNADLGNVLILQENDTACASGICSSPDDEGERPAGSFQFAFGEFETFSFALIDVENEEGGSITFTRFRSVVKSFSFSDFLGFGQNIAFGDHTANQVDLGEIGLFDAVTITLGGSGAIDEIAMRAHIPVPEPDTAGMIGLGLAGMALGRRRPR
jgi:hypothetical protein